jgi:hypothetical protein
MDKVFMARAIQLSVENVRSGRGGPFGTIRSPQLTIPRRTLKW